MNIGILTYHWATNYGAVLQAYALQEFLKERGHNVSIINYVPYTFKYNLKFFIKHPTAIFSIREILSKKEKDKLIDIFRQKYLQLSKLYDSFEKLLLMDDTYDVLISGSDQVLNPTFAICGENKPTGSYFLTFNKSAYRIGYAASYGCTEYPQEAQKYAKKWIKSFDRLSVRETSALSISSNLGYKSADLVPDPTILYGDKLFDEFQLDNKFKEAYNCIYLLRTQYQTSNSNEIVIDERTCAYTMENWISLIKNANGFITNSYHGMIMAILNHVPFAVLLETGEYSGMNDRFYTLLDILGERKQIVNNIEDAREAIKNDFCWEIIDKKIAEYREVGVKFLKKTI